MNLANLMNRRNLKIIGRICIIGLIGLMIFTGVYMFFLSQKAEKMFGSKKWELPARIYARPLEIYPGMLLDPKGFEQELNLMRYRRVKRIDASGSFSRIGNMFTFFTRSFVFEDGQESARKIRVGIQNNKVATIRDLETGQALSLVRLDPAHIGSFYPTHNEDRLWVRFSDVSPILIQTIMAVEDRDFYKHHGVRPMAILRAIIVNIKEGKAVQGGSTLTQQLVKNLFLTHKQTLRRKFDEAIMALSLEWSYEKDQIFEAYINEVYMGQEGKRAIHGFGMASQFYFGRSLSDLRPKEIALLVGLLKGPSYYDPRRFPDRARDRRNIVLKVMADQKLVRSNEAQSSIKQSLGVIAKPSSGTTPFPAFMDMVRRSLLKEYNEEDLNSEGLRIFTTLDPQVQFVAQKSVSSKLKSIESWRGLPKGKLQAGVIVTATSSNEVLALVGDRYPETYGFNRALDAQRSIGSLVKPAIYLTALELPELYTLITPIDDSRIQVKDPAQGMWVPKNYDRKYHGMVPLYKALAHSYNVAAVRLGLELGLENVFDTIRKLGIDRILDPYPSALLGAIPMSVLEVAQMYQTLASGGFYSRVRAIRSVYRPDGSALNQFPLTIREKIRPEAVYLINKSLQAVVAEGTAKSLKTLLPQNMGIAGKTGTSNDLRDSWFAGFSGNRLAVVWVGRDDNKPCGLSGSSGALKVWGDIMAQILNTPLKLFQPDKIHWVPVNPATGWRTHETCSGAVSVPFIVNSEPTQQDLCGQNAITKKQPAPVSQKPETLLEWLKEKF